MRTRFAPSPTGFLHVGGLRTALFSYILARQSKGKFLLRIEDTDQARSVEGTVESILRSLEWAGFAPEEGVMMRDGFIVEEGSKGPYFQSKRLPLYREHVETLLQKGHAYYCFCTPARLEEMRKGQEARKQAPMYDRHCLKLSPEEIQKKLSENTPHVIRLKVPHEKTITFEDDIRGAVSFQGHTIDDQVLLKSDGFPTYHLAHVVDDHLMEIDLVLRGEEWLSSLPKHLLLFEFLNWKPPRYAHVSLLLNKDKTKLSKRQNSVSVEEYIQKGYLPEALVNFIALLGWNPGTVQEMFTLDELVEAFTLDRVQKAGAVFDTEKLDWLQGQWMRRMPLAVFTERLRRANKDLLPALMDDAHLSEKAALIQDRITFLQEGADALRFFYEEPKVTLALLANPKQKIQAEDVPRILKTLIDTLTPIAEANWNLATLESELRAALERDGWKLGQLLWPLRAALTGLPFSPGAFEVAAALGKSTTLKRLQSVASDYPLPANR